MGISTFVAIVVGLVRAKFIALSLGPSGMGIFSQAVTFFQGAETICGLGIGFGITKYVSQMAGEQKPDEVKKVLATSFVLQLASFFLFFVPICIFSKQIAQFVFSSSEYSWLLILISGAFLFSILVTSCEATLLGLSRPKVFSMARVIYYLTGLGLLILFVGTMKIVGGFFYIAANAVVSFTIVGLSLARVLKIKMNVRIPDIIKALRKIDFKAYIGKLFSYGAAVLASSAFTWIMIIYVRSVLIKEAGTSANGFYQVIFALVGYYTPFFTNGMWGYLLPKLSGAKKTHRINFEINKAIRFILVFLIPAVAVIFLLKRVFVLVVFSEEFLPALDIFPLYLLGSLLFVTMHVIGITMLAKKKLGMFFSVNVSQYLLYAVLFTVLAPKMGLMAIAVSYLAMNIFANLAGGVYLNRKMNIALNARNLKLLFAGFIFIMAVFFIPSRTAPGLAFKWLLVALWFLFAVGRKEKALVVSFIRGRKR